MDERLFVGGSADGKWFMVDRSSFDVPAPTPRPDGTVYHPEGRPEMKVESYRAVILGDGKKEWTVMVHEQLEGDLFERLLKNYKP